MKFSNFSILLALFGLLAAACTPVNQPIPPVAQPQSLPAATESPIPTTLPSPIVQSITSNQTSPVTTPITNSKLFTTSQSDESPSLSEETLSREVTNLVDKAKKILVEKVPGINTAAIALIVADVKQWRDSSLGCPRKGMMYNQVITPGYLIVLKAEGKEYEFHTNSTEKVVLCLIDGQKINQ